MQEFALKHCRSCIEQRLGWGDAEHWTTQEFEDLSLRIQEQTGRAISATTLKRIWGRVAYHSSPSRHSLDTLALFLGHPSWRDFAHTSGGEVPLPVPSPMKASADGAISASPTTSHVPRGLRYLVVPVLLLGLGVAVWMGLKGTFSDAMPVDITFRSRAVTSGVPNTVIFDYNVSGIEADSFFIQQSWDQRRRALVAPEGRTHTSVYYRPGFFNAKLLADDRIVAEHPVHITTEGWIALIDEGASTPIYLTDAFSSSEGALSVAPTWLQAHGHDATATNQILEYYDVRSFGTVRTDSFSLETSLRRTVNDRRYPCGRAEISVLGERGAFQIPLSIPGCIGDMGLLLGMRYLEGTANDLSAFGVDLSTWQRVQLDVMGHDVKIQVGMNAPFTTQIAEDVGQVVGLRYRFEGAGAVDYVTLRDAEGAVVYDEAF